MKGSGKICKRENKMTDPICVANYQNNSPRLLDEMIQGKYLVCTCIEEKVLSGRG